MDVDSGFENVYAAYMDVLQWSHVLMDVDSK